MSQQSPTTEPSSSAVVACPFLDELRWRGLINQCTNEPELARHLNEKPRSIYVGFDPTADSLTIGNLVPIMMLKRAQMHGHRPVIVMGGGTGLVGDPSGKSAERQLLTRKTIDDYVASQRRIFEAIMDFDVPEESRPVIVNNADWLCEIGFLDMLRDVGKHFSVNMMIQKDSVRDRLHNRDQGISFTEFSYMILQAYDFKHLFDDQSVCVTVQMGGSDQWGNIVAGADLIRRTSEADRDENAPPAAFGLTNPLVTKADGGKFGKTESGAIWLTPERTSPFAFHQFWLNTSDDDAQNFLRIFTLFSQQEIADTVAAHIVEPHKRGAQKVLADHMTDLLYGVEAREGAVRTAQALFSGNIKELSATELEAALAEAPSSTMSRETLAGDGIALIDVLVQVHLASSKREAREFLQGGSVTVNGDKVGIDDTLTTAHLLHGTTTAIRRGKKHWHVIRWS